MPTRSLLLKNLKFSLRNHATVGLILSMFPLSISKKVGLFLWMTHRLKHGNACAGNSGSIKIRI